MAEHEFLPLTVKQDTPDWRDSGACKDHPKPDLWFANKGTVDLERARNVCEGCPVRRQCLEDALAHDEYDDYGLWGGLDEAQRKRLRRKTA